MVFMENNYWGIEDKNIPIVIENFYKGINSDFLSLKIV